MAILKFDNYAKNSDIDFFNQSCKFASAYFTLPDIIEIKFDNCPSRRFPTKLDPCVFEAGANGEAAIYFNTVWYSERIESHRDDVRFFFFHELRHLYQHIQINSFDSGAKIEEKREIIEKWKWEFEHYIPNEGDHDSMVKNVNQEVEVDANAYGWALSWAYNEINSIHTSLQLSLPEEARIPSKPIAEEYVRTRSEFADYRKAVTRRKRELKWKKQAFGIQGRDAKIMAGRNPEKKQQPIVKGKKIGRNELCPCGSGKKYKHCCGKNKP